MLKRGFDVAASAVGLLVCALPMLIIALVILVRMGRPILFRQVRPGRYGNPFVLNKFRTMSVATVVADDSPADAPGGVLREDSGAARGDLTGGALENALGNEPGAALNKPDPDRVHPDHPKLDDPNDEARITVFGAFLRRTSLDELPELFNVLTGDMSLVGPRPLLMEYLPLYSDTERRRHEVRPGVTGWAQVHGRNTVVWEKRFALDVWYVDNRTFWLDLTILWRTLALVISREGITEEGHATMSRFTGSQGRGQGR